jgi:hypothetical protein
MCSGEIHLRLVLQHPLDACIAYQKCKKHLMALLLTKPATRKHNIQFGFCPIILHIISNALSACENKVPKTRSNEELVIHIQILQVT